ncbi:hypothetical protein AeRB84_015581 [Aphanomyces euteiches]|nr:hypothetical protein AeRB84_015581 [Aphanomyces euteiches]
MIPNSNQHIWVYQFGTHECHEVDSSSLMPWKGDMHFSFAHAQLSLATVSAECLATFGCAIREAEDFINVFIALQKGQSKTENSFLNPRSSQTFCRPDSGPSCTNNTNMAKNKLSKASRTTSLQGTERVDQSFVTLETSRQHLAGRNDLSNRIYEYISELEYVKSNALNKASKESLQHFCLTTYSFLGGFGEVVKRSDTSPRVFASTHHAIIVGVVSLVLGTALGECNTPTTNEMGPES